MKQYGFNYLVVEVVNHKAMIKKLKDFNPIEAGSDKEAIAKVKETINKLPSEVRGLPVYGVSVSYKEEISEDIAVVEQRHE